MTDKEVIIVDGVNVLECDEYYIEQVTDQVKCSLSGRYCEENKNCMFKQLARKTQECEELKKTSNKYYIQVLDERDKLRKEVAKFNEKLELIRLCGTEPLKAKCSRYRKALEEIAGIAKDGLNPICYKSNCSRCQCYDGDDCNARMNALINNYFTENGEFFDGNGDFAEAIEALLDEERSSCNRAKPISQQILDIIADLRTDETKCNPDSEQIEHTAAKTQMRNSGSVEQIQDSKAKGGK